VNYIKKNFTVWFLPILSGIILGLAYNKYFPIISLFIGFVPLLYLIKNYKLSFAQSFKYTFIAFFIFHFIMVGWLYKSSVFGFFAIIIINSSFMAFVFGLITFTKQKLGNIAFYLSFILYWIAFEYLHYHWEISWPFMNLGHWIAQKPTYIQYYEYTGILGGSLWILSANLLLFLFVDFIINNNIKKAYITVTSAATIIIFPILISQNIYNFYNEKNKAVNVLIIQPNINPYTKKYNNKLFDNQINTQIKNALDNADKNTDFIIFPEASFPIYLDETLTENSEGITKNHKNDKFNSNSLNILKNTNFKKLDTLTKIFPNSKIIGGLYSYKLINEDTVFYNTAFQIDSSKMVQIYHKSKLVIGVEKIPFQKYFSFLKTLNLDFGGNTNSIKIDKKRSNFISKKATIAPIICYESVYSEFVTDFVKKGADIIFVITNDGWWGKTQGYYQHLLCSQIRAVETRRAVARAANTGISCLINQKGEIHNKIPTWTKSVLKGKVNLNKKNTFYVKYGNLIGKISLFLSVILLSFTIYKNKMP